MIRKQAWAIHFRAAVWTLLLALALSAASALAAEKQWFKGNIHCHSLWSDADVFPENAIDWYKNHGYQFFSLSDHNRFQEGQRWIAQQPPRKGDHGNRGVATPRAMEVYRVLFGPEWVDECTSAGKRMVRLKTLEEIRPKFEEAGRFLLIPGEEITTTQAHVNVHNLPFTVEPPKLPQGQADPRVWMARAITNAIAARQKGLATLGKSGLLVQLNHPGWARSPMTHDEVSRMDFFNVMEINNDDSGTPASIPGCERMWDAVLASRLKRGLPPIMVTAGDDTHEYLQPNTAPDGGLGHGWIMVRAAELSAESLFAAIAKGDFYASSGVILRDLQFNGKKLALQIEPRGGARFTTEFVGMRKGEAPGQILATTGDLNPSYELKGDELYVRAKITSNRTRPVRDHEPVPEMAWTQPVMRGRTRTHTD